MRFTASLLVVSALVASGCACPGADPSSVKKAGALAPPDPGHYAERSHDGRIYVFADPKTEESFEKTKSLQICRTLIGAGPNGETVVFEARDKVPEMTDRIVAEFSARHGVALR